MPPRSAKKAAAKKSSSKVKITAPTPSAPSPSVVETKPDPELEIPTVVSEKVPEADAGPVPVVKQEVVTEDEVVPLTAVEGNVPKSEVEVETVTAPEQVGEAAVLDMVREEADPEEVLYSEEPTLEAAVLEQVGQAAVSEMVGDEANPEEVLYSEESTLVAAEDLKPLAADKETDGEDEEADGEENEMAVEEGDEEIIEEEKGEGDIGSIIQRGIEGACNVEAADGFNYDNSVEHDESDEENEEDDPTLYMQAPPVEGTKQRDFEIFIGGLDKGAVEDDLIEVFGVFGEIQSVRIVKHPLTQKSKGFAFVRYASVEHAKEALAKLKDGTKVKGKQIRISASEDNDTLYLGNICKTWTQDQVIEALKGFGVEHIEHILLPDDFKNEGRIKGFGFLEFSSHSAAMAAFQRLRKPDALFGRDISAKVAFAQTPLHPSEDALLQVKTVYVEGIPVSWDEEKIKELCEQYGEIEKVQLSRNFTAPKRKDFGFVEFTSRECAIACVEGINNAELGEGKVNVKANLAKPMYKGRLAKQGARGGYKVKKDGEATEEAGPSKKKKKAKSKGIHKQERTQPKLSITGGSQGKVSEGKNGPQTSQGFKGKKRGRQGTDTITNERSSKKARNNRKYGKVRGRPSSGHGNQRNTYSTKPYAYHQTAYATRYPPPSTSYQAYAYAGSSGAQHRQSDLEPHAGYLPAAKEVRNPYEYELRRAGTYDSQPRGSSGYAGAAPVIQTSYPGYSSYAGYEAGYAYPRSGAYAPQGPYY